MGEPFREAADQQAGLHPEATLVGPALGTGEDTGCRAGERGPALAEEAAAGAQGHGPASGGFWSGWRVCGCDFLGVPVPESRTMNDPLIALKGPELESEPSGLRTLGSWGSTLAGPGMCALEPLGAPVMKASPRVPPLPRTRDKASKWGLWVRGGRGHVPQDGVDRWRVTIRGSCCPLPSQALMLSALVLPCLCIL